MPATKPATPTAPRLDAPGWTHKYRTLESAWADCDNLGALLGLLDLVGATDAARRGVAGAWLDIVERAVLARYREETVARGIVEKVVGMVRAWVDGGDPAALPLIEGAYPDRVALTALVKTANREMKDEQLDALLDLVTMIAEIGTVGTLHRIATVTRRLADMASTLHLRESDAEVQRVACIKVRARVACPSPDLFNEPGTPSRWR